MLLAKNEVLDVTKVPGIDLEKALDDAAMGRTSPETQAITRAYQQFYGPSSRQQQEEMLHLGATACAGGHHLENPAVQ
jgi:hypothetical protein